MKNKFEIYEQRIIEKALRAYAKKMNCKYSEVEKIFESENRFEVLVEFLNYEELFWLVACSTIPNFYPLSVDRSDERYRIVKKVRDGFYFPFVAGISFTFTDENRKHLNRHSDNDIQWLGVALMNHESIEYQQFSDLFTIQAKIQKERLAQYLKITLE